MINFSKLIIGFLLLLIFIGCEKEDAFPLETRVGANTLAAKVDGLSFVAKPGLFSPKETEVLYSPGPNESLVFEGANYTSTPTKTIIITIRGTIKVGQYNLGEDSGSFALWKLRSSPDESIFTTSKQATGIVTLTRADHLAKIYSGTFEFKAVNPQGQVVTISKGRFDLKGL